MRSAISDMSDLDASRALRSSASGRIAPSQHSGTRNAAFLWPTAPAVSSALCRVASRRAASRVGGNRGNRQSARKSSPAAQSLAARSPHALFVESSVTPLAALLTP